MHNIIISSLNTIEEDPSQQEMVFMFCHNVLLKYSGKDEFLLETIMKVMDDINEDEEMALSLSKLLLQGSFFLQVHYVSLH